MNTAYKYKDTHILITTHTSTYTKRIKKGALITAVHIKTV